jgi:predicted metal-dependent phosphoesterase TrpH
VKKLEPPVRSDFHCHSIFSDGALTPEQLVDYALDKRRDVRVLALTDHDSMNGIDRAVKHIRENSLPLVLIPGIEISTTWKCGSCTFQIHVVGLSCRSDDEKLKSVIDAHSRIRDSQADKISNELIKIFSIDPDDIGGMVARLREQNTFVTRKHFSDFLQSRKLVKDNDEAFKKYLGSGGRAFFQVDFSSVETAVEAIHSAGGVAVLAHPFRYEKMHKSALKKLVEYFSGECHGDGIEGGSPSQRIDEKLFIRDLAKKYGFYCSVGSDFHMPGIPCRCLGQDLWLPEGVKPIWEHESIAGYFTGIQTDSQVQSC